MATLDAQFGAIVDAFRQLAAARGFATEDTETAFAVRVRAGRVTLQPDGHRTAMTIEAPNAVDIQLIRDTIAGRAADLGVSISWHQKMAKGRPANFSLATVTEVRRLTPNYTRVVIDGPDLARFATGPKHFRLLFGPEGADWPFTDEGGITQWPGGPEAWHRPVYTSRSILVRPDGSAQILFDVFLHDGGRVTEWTRRTRPGTEVGLTGPGGGRGPAEVQRHVLIGDETAVPVIARILSELPDEVTGQANLFVPDAGDAQDLKKPAGVSVTWHLSGQGETPLSVLTRASLPSTDRYVFFAGERSDVFAARDYLRAEGFEKTEFHAATYWTADKG